MYFVVVEMGSCYVAQASVEFIGSATLLPQLPE